MITIGDEAIPTSIHNERRWSAVFLGLIVGLLLGLLWLPDLTLERKLYLLLHGVCAQTHNIVAGGVQLPLCARDSGMYLSYLVTFGVSWWRGRGRAGRMPPLPLALVFLGLFLVMVADGINSTLAELLLPYAYTPRNDLRLLTGMGAGSALAVVVQFILNNALWRDVEPPKPIIGQWRELAIIGALDAAIVAALALDTPLLAWPLALLVVVGLIGNLTIVLTLVIAIALGRANRVVRLTQLAHPATIGLLLTLVMIITMARYRIWMEVTGLVPMPVLPK